MECGLALPHEELGTPVGVQEDGPSGCPASQTSQPCWGKRDSIRWLLSPTCILEFQFSWCQQAPEHRTFYIVSGVVSVQNSYWKSQWNCMGKRRQKARGLLTVWGNELAPQSLPPWKDTAFLLSEGLSNKTPSWKQGAPRTAHKAWLKETSLDHQALLLQPLAPCPPHTTHTGYLEWRRTYLLCTWCADIFPWV